MSRRWGVAAVALSAAVAVTVAGCGGGAAPQTPDEAEGGDVPTTARALAYVVAEHTGEPAAATAEDDAAEEFASGGVGTVIGFGSRGDFDSDRLVVAVGKGLDEAVVSCDSTASLADCVSTDQGTLSWEEQAPEEDPGVVYLTVPKGDAHVLMFYGGPNITGDPRELDMPLSVEELFEIAADPRIDVTTSQAAVDAGKELAFWERYPG